MCDYCNCIPYQEDRERDINSYPLIATKVDIAMKHTEKPCIGGECDGDSNCERHNRTVDIVLRMTKKR